MRDEEYAVIKGLMEKGDVDGAFDKIMLLGRREDRRVTLRIAERLNAENYTGEIVELHTCFAKLVRAEGKSFEEVKEEYNLLHKLMCLHFYLAAQTAKDRETFDDALDYLDYMTENSSTGYGFRYKAYVYKEGSHADKNAYIYWLRRSFRHMRKPPLEEPLSKEELHLLKLDVIDLSEIRDIWAFCQQTDAEKDIDTAIAAYEYMLQGNTDWEGDVYFEEVARQLTDFYSALGQPYNADAVAEDYYINFKHRDSEDDNTEYLIRTAMLIRNRLIAVLGVYDKSFVYMRDVSYGEAEQRKMIAEAEELLKQLEAADYADGNVYLLMGMVYAQVPLFENKGLAAEFFRTAKSIIGDLPDAVAEYVAAVQQEEADKIQTYKINFKAAVKKTAGFLKKFFDLYTDTSKVLEGVTHGRIIQRGVSDYLIDTQTGREYPIFNFDNLTGLFTDAHDNIYEFDMKYPNGDVINITDKNQRLG